MDLNVKEISASEKEIEVTLKYDEIQKEIETEVKKQTREIQLPGFRKGKVPMHLIKKRYGDALEYDASEKIANTHFWKIAEDKELNPIGHPVMTDLKFKPGEDLHFKVKYEVMPQIDVKNYTGIEIEVPDFKIKNEEVEKEIEYIILSNRTFEEAEVVGDDNNYILNVEMFKLNEDGEPENEKGEMLEIDLTNEGVNKEIIKNSKGKKTGESFAFSFDDEQTVTNDEGKEEKVKKHYNYKIVLKSIKKINNPELNEELIKKASKDKASTEEELREEIRKDLQHYFDHRAKEIIKDKLIEKIIENNNFTPPATLVNNILDQLVENEEKYLDSQGLKNINRDELRKRNSKTAENDVKWFLLKSEILKKENLSVTDDELKEMAEKESEKTGISVDKLINYYKNSGQNEKLLDKKLFDFLTEKNNIKKVDPEKFAKTESKEEK
ncbi:trigger factor [bacterium BMS3Abin03]|nr:trigger factor [bacterium BMS3Abin03]